MYALVDCDNFFCSCERVFRPDLNGRAIVVLSNNDGCVVARSAEAKALGIRMGLPFFQMQQDFAGHDIVAFSSNYALYGDMSARVMAVLRQAAPAMLQYSIDECFLDLRDMPGTTDQLKVWGEQLAARVRQWTGIPVSIGIAATKTLAKVASRYAKRYPGYRKCCIIATEQQREKALQLFDVGDVWGVGRRMAKSLADAGVKTAYDLTQKPQEWVRAKYHITGERTWSELRGQPSISLDDMNTTTRQSIMTSRSFPDMLTEYDDLRAHVANYAARCAAKLRRQHTVCAQVTVFIASNHFREDLLQYDAAASAAFATATSDTIQIVDKATQILHTIFRQNIRYKRAGVMVTDITPDSAVQPDLFEYDPKRAGKLNELSAAMDRINTRLGADTVILGAQQYKEVDAQGRHVKFTGAIRRALLSPYAPDRPFTVNTDRRNAKGAKK